MEFSYAYWCLIWMICMTKTAGQEIELTFKSLGTPDYYINDMLRLNCTTSGYVMISVQRFLVNDSPDAGCVYDVDTFDTFIRRENTKLELISEDYCRDTGSRTGFILSGFLKITPNLAGLQIKCRCEINARTSGLSNILSISTVLKVAPKGLAFVMTNQDQPVMEGETFEFRCVTTSASESAYRYDIKRNGIIVMEDIGNSYTPNEQDRLGFRVVCEDTVHVNWRGGNTSTESQIFYPLHEGMPTPTSTAPGTGFTYEIIGILALVIVFIA